MRRFAKTLFRLGMIGMTLFVLASCGRRNQLLNRSASNIVEFQLDTQNAQTTQATDAVQQSVPSGTANTTTAPAETPQPAGKTAATTTATDADIDGLMDELETTLNELEASITAADKDTLTDSALVALAK